MSEFVKTGDLTEDGLRHHRQELEELEKAQEGRAQEAVLFEETKEERPRRPRQKHTVEVLSGNPASLPRIWDIIGNKTQYLRLRAVLGDELWRRYFKVFRSAIRDANSQLVVLSYISSIYVASDQKELLRETVSNLLPVLEEKRKEYLQRVAEIRRRKGSRNKGALQPDNIGVLAQNLRTKYKEGEPIFYRRDEFKQFCGMSHETISLIIRLARRDKVIPFLPKRESGVSVSHTREEMILVLNHVAKLWQEGKSAFAEGIKARKEIKARTGILTLQETAKNLGLPVEVFVSWIKEGKISVDSDLKETIERISNYYRSKQRVINPALLESEDVKKLLEQWADERNELYWTNFNRSAFQHHRELFATVSDVVQEVVGINIYPKLIPVLVKELGDRGISVKDLPHKKSDGTIIAYFRVLRIQDMEEAVKIVQEVMATDSRFARYRQESSDSKPSS